jgi:hypothetical protein
MTQYFAVFYFKLTILKGRAVHLCNVCTSHIPQYRSNTCAACSYSALMDSRWYGPQPAWRKAWRLGRRVIPGCDDRTGRIQRCTRLDVCCQETSVSGTYLSAATGTEEPQRTSYLSMQPLWRRNFTVLSTPVNYFVFFAWKAVLSWSIHYEWRFFNFLWELFLRLCYGSCIWVSKASKLVTPF